MGVAMKIEFVQNKKRIRFESRLAENAVGYNPTREYTMKCGESARPLSLVSGEEYVWKEIHGCCQGEYNRVIYPESRFSEQDIRNFECEFFNLGTEWCVTD